MRKEEQIKQKIKYSSIIYLIIALLIIPFYPFLASPALIIGGILLAISTEDLEEIIKGKTAILILAILSIIFNPLAGVLLFLTFDEVTSAKKESINSPPEQEKNTVESKRIESLLKLALVMIIVSGILFATTTWEIISDFMKIIALTVMGLIFMGLSYYSEKKFKIKRIAKAYFILGLSFFLLTWVGIGYFGTISTWFSYSGDGKYFVYLITFILLSIMLYLTNYKFKENEYLYLAHGCNYLCIFILLKALKLDIVTSTLVVSILVGILNVIPNKNKYQSLFAINETVSLVLWAILVTKAYDANIIVLVIASIINIFNILNTVRRKNATIEGIYAVIISYVLLIVPATILETTDSVINLTIMISATIFSLVMKKIHPVNNKHFINTSQIVFYIISFATIQQTISTSIAIIIAAMGLLTNIINELISTDENNKLDILYQPFAIFFLTSSIITYFNEMYRNIATIYMALLSIIIYAIVHNFTQNEKKKKYYNYVLLIGSVITYLANLSQTSLITNFALIIISIYIYIVSLNKKELMKLASYIFIILNIHTTSLALITEPYGSILSILVITLLILVTQDKKIKAINSFAVIFPAITFIDNMDYYSRLRPLIIATLALYILYLIIKYFVKKQKDLVATIILPFIMLYLLENRGLLSALYIGILMLILVFLTFNKEEYKKLFYCSIIITIANIIIQLWGYWSKIPLWLYLLLAGIAIIAFVTYKEQKKTESNDLELKQNEEEHKKKQKDLSKDIETQIEKNKQEEAPINKNNLQKEVEESLKEETLEETKPIKEKTVGNFCPICGTKNTRNGKFCSNCGQNLEL